jgi:plastocyanin
VPSNFTANVGDVVVFEFYPTNHSVVKADFDAPCVPASGEIFWSGMFNTFDEQDGQLVGSVSEHR